jgi:hypothetical protein|tara:strand:- start:95 stop:262 length:168 start_codon:yes stop_codon:yes gene_type:complete
MAAIFQMRAGIGSGLAADLFMVKGCRCRPGKSTKRATKKPRRENPPGLLHITTSE